MSAGGLIRPRYRPDIDGLRAVAVLAVVAFHAFPREFPGGFIGVDIFFVISGFLISTIIFESLAEGRFSFTEFYARRVARIFPALLLVLAASYAFGWFELLAPDYKQLGRHIAGGAGFVANFILWNESGYFDTAAEMKPLLHLWSLGIEEQFYLCWPLLCWLAWKTRRALLHLALAVALLSFLVNVDSAGSNVVDAFYSPLSRWWELMAGAVLAYALHHGRVRFASWSDRFNISRAALCGLASWCGFILIAAGLALISKDVRFPGWWALLPVAGAVCLIAAGGNAFLNRTVLCNRVMVWTGLISYPLYLWHWPLLAFARLHDTAEPSVAVRVAAVALSFVLAWLTFRFIEMPVRHGAWRNRKAIALALSMAVVGWLGYDAYARDGLGFRFPRIVQDLTEFSFDRRTAYREGSCFLTEKQDARGFDACTIAGASGKSAIFIWGDSHAAHLYPGFVRVFGNDHAIVQRTASGCPPLIGVDVAARPQCREINAQVLASIRTLRPAQVVLAAHWTVYDWTALELTVRALREAGVPAIDVIGPLPEWQRSLPTLLYLQLKADPARPVPVRTRFGLNEKFRETDAALGAYAAKLQVNYVSPSQFFCNDDGCVTRFGDSGDTIAFWDCCHLTDAGSSFLASQLQRK